MVHRKLDKVPGEMCAAADEDLLFRNMCGVRAGIFWDMQRRKGEVYRMLGKSGEAMRRGKDQGTYVDDPLRHEFTPSEGIKQCLKFSMPC